MIQWMMLEWSDEENAHGGVEGDDDNDHVDVDDVDVDDDHEESPKYLEVVWRRRYSQFSTLLKVYMSQNYFWPC